MKVESFCNKALVVCSSIILAFLTFMSLFFTQRVGRAEWGEIVGFITQKIRDKGKFIIILTSLLSFLLAVVILQGGKRTPIDDQIQVCSAASLFNQGSYINMTKGGYINIYPHQLGLVLFYQFVFRIFGDLNYQAIQYINCLFIAGAVYLMLLCLQELCPQNWGMILSGIFVLMTLPLYLLSSWVYGDIPAFFFIMLSAYGFLKFVKHEKKKWLTLMFVGGVIAVVIRKNSIIMIIAMVITLFICSLNKKKKTYAITAILLMTLPLLGITGIQKYYENISGYEVDGGIPGVMFVAMGMMDAGSKPGWFSNYHVSTYYSVDCDREEASEQAVEEIKSRMNMFLEEPLSAISFYKRKICTQWNDPYYNTERIVKVDNMDDIEGFSAFLFYHENEVRKFLSIIQMLTYMGGMLYCICVASRRQLYENISLVILVGGFLFSILWEANSRYVFFYVLFLIPLSVIGWEFFGNKILSGMIKGGNK